ncbi:uncharacterized protein Eint_071160 [Encephalitozoon intestinalis ATCC 50506]|uniref:Uncharacterized protein n=1 Tax=Encephalitozoon intestinalis (strain ATCC 50506) TaxID=876142 RepID=E0S844_ENCIT|nr:uncharacterized protein Eint_071160 [Encephalitozoon intestinalis ATCC 50506]ADM11879.2 hypothetical protein Eint_071160 [Encephalitozoon intestinalis ATCC 50506]UTX45635.1 hypothetical protein GPK93_07g12000 [Encephalitozoon intestinalis]
MEGEGNMEKVKEMLQRYSSRGGSFSEGSFLSDIDMSDASFGSWEEELVGRIMKSLRHCKEMAEMGRRRKIRLSPKETAECALILDSIKRNIKGFGETRKNWILWGIPIGLSFLGIAYISAKYYF